MNLLERIWDRIFWTVFLLVVIVLALVVLAFDFFFESFFPEEYNLWFSEDAGNAIDRYRAFAVDHPVLCWFLQWPLLMVGL